MNVISVKTRVGTFFMRLMLMIFTIIQLLR